MLKVFQASYNYRGGYGGYDEKEFVVIAETEGVALGLILEANTDTVAAYWDVKEIPTDKAAAHYISSRSS